MQWIELEKNSEFREPKSFIMGSKYAALYSGGNHCPLRLFALQTILQRESKTKGLLLSHGEKCRNTRDSENYVPELFSPCFYSPLAFAEFPHEYITLINLTDRGWDQICPVCLIWHLIKGIINRTWSSKMKQT